MNTTLLVLDDNNKWQELDLYEELSINVIIQETDITDIEARRSPYSKTFQIPGTKINNDFFEHFYEVNSIGFNPLTRRQTVVQYRGTDIFKGYLSLNSVTRTQDKIEYEIYILSELTDFVSQISNSSLKDLDWNDLNHIQNYNTVKLSWSADYTDTNGLYGGRVLYPMAHWGLEYPTTGSNPTFEFAINTTGNTGIDYSGSSIPPTYFKPAVRLYEIMSRIIATTGYDVESTFFNSNYFRAIYMDVGVNGLIGPVTAQDKTNQNIFRTYLPDFPTGQKFYWSNGDYEQLLFGRINETDGYDPSLNFNELSSSYQIPYGGQYSFEFLGKVNQLLDNNAVGTSYNIAIFKSSSRFGLSNPATRTIVAQSSNFIANNYNPSNNKRIALNNISLNAGDHIGLFIKINQTILTDKDAGLWVLPYEDLVDTYPGARWDLYNSPTFIGNNFVDMKLQFPEVSCIDFFKSIVKLFNLVVVQTKDPKKFRIEPLPWYYAQNFSDTVDWTQRFDLNSPYKIEPVNFQLKKEVNLQYESSDKEYLGKLWEDQYGFPYGTKRFMAKSDILTDTQTITFPFRPVPTEVISGSTNIIIPMFYELDQSNQRQIPTSNKNHLFFWVGNRYFYEDQTYTIAKTWYMTSGATPTQQTTYPCISHLSTLDNQNPNNISDLNFDKSFDFFGDDNTIIQQFTQYNLYQLWYGDYFTNLYSPEVKRLTGRILLNPLDVSRINLTDKIFIKDSLFNIEKVNEADLVNWKLTEVSLLKQVAQYNKIVPPAPVYEITPGQAYPPSAATFMITGYTSQSKNQLCFNQATGVTLWSSTAVINDGTYIYSDSGSTTPYTTGYFFRETTASTVYQVINNLGYLVENDC